MRSPFSMSHAIAAIAGVLLYGIPGCADPASKVNSGLPGRLTTIPEPADIQPPPLVDGAAIAAPVPPEEAIWARLQQPETHYVVLIRHALAPGTGDPVNFDLGDCSTQRNLSEEGRSQARRTGAAFRQRNIPIRQVLSSQWCRCLETAELMDLGAVEPFAPLNSFFENPATGAAQTAAVRTFILNQARTPGVTVMVTHFVNISGLSGVTAPSGGMVVIQRNDQEQLEVVGQLDAL
jgi:phosphohistidine phosphatase SixA